MKRIELLAPAGSFEALKAALQNGADAVYLGGTEFSARAYASNFDRKTLQEAVEYSHIRGMRVYVTINTLMKDQELGGLLEYVAYLYEIDVDAVIVQDLGVLTLIRKSFPDFEVHCSTQMTLHNSYGVELLKEMGVQRVVLARELSLGEIDEIHQQTGMELEVFVHGALCVSYSGQCLMSSFIGGRSGNRGRCAQPCRKPYQLVSTRGEVGGLAKENYHLSMRDLNTFEEISKLIESGVTSFKIEGRMKKPQYVASIVRSYRQGIDYYLKNKKSLIDENAQHEMAQMFNRRFTKGYIFESPKSEIVNIEKPNNRGIYLGKVSQYNRQRNRLQILLKSDIAVGDGIEVWQGYGSNEGGTVLGIHLDQKPVPRATPGQLVEVELRGNIQAGDDIYKTLDIQMMENLGKTYAHQVENKKIEINGEIKIGLGQPISLMLWDLEEHYVYQTSDFIVEKAQKVALTEERLLENLKKLGNTPYDFNELKVELETEVSVPLSIINGLRRDAIDQLTAQRKNQYNREIKKIPRIPSLAHRQLGEKNIDQKIHKIMVKVDRLDQLRIVLEEKVDQIYYGDINTFPEATDLCKDKGISIYFRSPAIMRNEDYRRMEASISNSNISGILAGDLGMVDFSKNRLQGPIRGDYSLNTMNSYTLNYLKELGMEGVVLSPELDFKIIRELKIDPQLQWEAIIYGRLPVMSLEYCPLHQLKQCDHRCEGCKLASYHYSWGLKDQKEMIFPLGKDCWGRSIILNSQTLYMMDKIQEFDRSNITNYRVEFTNENPKEISSTLKHLQQQLKALFNGKNPREVTELQHLVDDGFTRGHYYRGVE